MGAAADKGLTRGPKGPSEAGKHGVLGREASTTSSQLYRYKLTEEAGGFQGVSSARIGPGGHSMI